VGSGVKNTETFHVSSAEWRISWDTRPRNETPGNFWISVFTAEGVEVALVGNVMGEDTDASIMRGTGDYYLGIVATQPYTIVVEAR